uniref:Uncharacterized protein n=1 Tax=Myoviridae sp. ctIty1 TaxID=2827673 RepID=A0A8S5TGB9_9CAUD|nr:MAG TPA: hypothetical protein [Myoviridae sp. ctIty1]
MVKSYILVVYYISEYAFIYLYRRNKNANS